MRVFRGKSAILAGAARLASRGSTAGAIDGEHGGRIMCAEGAGAASIDEGVVGLGCVRLHEKIRFMCVGALYVVIPTAIELRATKQIVADAHMRERGRMLDAAAEAFALALRSGYAEEKICPRRHTRHSCPGSRLGRAGNRGFLAINVSISIRPTMLTADDLGAEAPT